MAKRNFFGAGAVIVALATATLGTTPASASASAASSTPGVTATTIRVGVPYVDVAAVKALGVDIDWGSVPDAFNAVIKDINAHGGINGRKIVPYIVAVNPTGTAPAQTACTQLTEDDNVFVAISPLSPTCYLQHNIPVVASIYPSPKVAGTAQDFSATPPTTAYDPLQLSVYDKQGVFKNKKVAIFGGTTSDEAEIGMVKSNLAKLHVPVVATAIDSAPQGDLAAENGQVATIAERFKSSGVNEVVAVGDGSAVWPEGLSAEQSTYNPSWVATNEGNFSGSVGGKYSPQYLSNVVTSTAVTPPAVAWNNAGTQRCVHLVKKAYPNDGIKAYNPSLPESEITYTSVEFACSDMALFEAIAKAAGKNLTVSSFVHAGYGLKNLTLPGANAPISFGPGRPYALGPVYMVHYNPTKKILEFSNKSAS
jgi:ABC-type branched-subunit amino acid transport system substrate-binding protein